MILGYARVSTSNQAGPEKTSLDEQENRIRAYAMAQGVDRFGVQMYVDAGESGAVPLEKRPEGRKLLAEVQPGDTVVAAKLDRLFRNATDALVTAEKWKQQGVKLVLWDISSEPVYDSPVAKMFFSILAAVAGFERERIGERILQGKEGKRAKGGHVGGPPPYGYRIDGARATSRLVPDPDEQRVVRMIRQRAKEAGADASEIARQLNRQGIMTRSGKPWQFIQVSRVLERNVQ